MVSREELKRSGLRAYEAGRLRSAARAAWLLVPAVIVCALETGANESCACVGVLLLSVSVYLRWRDRRGVDAVRYGLLAGVAPLVVGLLVARVAPGCADAPLLSLCTAVCLGVGVASGIWLGRRFNRGTSRTSTWLAATGIAVLAASLGCVGLGVAGIVGAAVGLLLGVGSIGALARVTA